MNKRNLFVFAFITMTSICQAQECLSLSSNERMAQAQLKGIIELWCEDHFKDCFDFPFIDIKYINSDISIKPNGAITVSGTNRNSGLFGKEYTREFIATIKCTSESSAKIHFKKQQKFTHAPDRWLECTKTVYF
ncbi:MAG: hypothetical protein ACJATI_001058 [Halioglobus sp.]|jgi:hypothetical protein